MLQNITEELIKINRIKDMTVNSNINCQEVYVSKGKVEKKDLYCFDLTDQIIYLSFAITILCENFEIISNSNNMSNIPSIYEIPLNLYMQDHMYNRVSYTDNTGDFESMSAGVNEVYVIPSSHPTVFVEKEKLFTTKTLALLGLSIMAIILLTGLLCFLANRKPIERIVIGI